MTELFEEYVPGTEGAPLPDGLVVRAGAYRDVRPIATLMAERNGWDVDVITGRFERTIVMPDSANLVCVAELEGEVLGYGQASLFAPPSDAPKNAGPPGWYLNGLGIAPAWRRRGIGGALTEWRIATLAPNADALYYFAAESNAASVDLHAALGFRELTRDFWFPGLSFTHSDGVLYRLDLADHGG